MTRLEKLEEAFIKYHAIDDLPDRGLYGKYSWIRWLAWRKLDFFPENTEHIARKIKEEKLRLNNRGDLDMGLKDNYLFKDGSYIRTMLDGVIITALQDVDESDEKQLILEHIVLYIINMQESMK